MPMLKAIIFDCDGVIADTEPIHMSAFGRVLAEEGITLTKKDYFAHYLALDDRGCFTRAFAERRPSFTRDQVNELIRRKAGYVEQLMKADLQLLPGAAEFIRRAAESYPLAVASGALRAEIETVVNYGGLRDCFRVIVSAEDVARSKPYPDPFIKALELLNLPITGSVEPGECLVIEDSIHGICAAHQAEMRCLAVTNSYPREKLSEAELVVDSLAGLSLKDVKRLFDA
jgi:HAD superfamily hydrolase (TIGR01509 family)